MSSRCALHSVSNLIRGMLGKACNICSHVVGFSWQWSVKTLLLKQINLVASSYRNRRSVFHKCVNAFRDRINAVCTTALINYSVSFAIASCKRYKHTDMTLTSLTETTQLRCNTATTKSFACFSQCLHSSVAIAWAENGF